MQRAYIFFGFLVCGLFIYASYSGWSVADSIKSGSWGPAGASGHGVYHK